ncbi:MAG: alpha-glucosidase/alpha-galactosidase [Oscillospiraceae bacterium]|jgi:alpha-galactosidase|nr:alpha-glucosidase/alpha-galactosidase [Oscillospiraceae bacterium]
MKFTDNKNLKIAYIGGGSRSWARVFMTDLALEGDLGGEIKLYDIDRTAAEDNETIGNRISAMSEASGKWKYTAVGALENALDGADFVIISILPGTFEEMHTDVHLPERLGIYQSVGDTAGPGGTIRALRTIPLFTGFAKAIKQHCPDAWVINYTNPMSLCVRALYHAFPKIKAFGCCHEVFGAQELLAEMVRRRTEEKGVQRSDIHVNVLGLNHFTWFDKASWKNYDLLEMYSEFTDEFYESGFGGDNSELPDKCFTCNNRVKFDLFRNYGLIAAAGDRHLAEFMPGDLYLKNPETAESWGFYLTSVDWRSADLKRKLEQSRRLVSGEENIILKPSGEEGILLIKALCGLTRVISNVNLPNTNGQIGNFPADTIVETNAVFSRDDVRPLYAGNVPEKLLGLMQRHIENQAMTLNAALEFDREKVYRIFEKDPLSNGKSDVKLINEMIKNTLKYLPEEWNK